jgi:hypothetical protein
MTKDPLKYYEQEEEKFQKQIEAILWKSGFVASKPVGILGRSEGYKVTIYTMLAFISYETDRGNEVRIQMLTKYTDALCRHGLEASICHDDSTEPYVVV